MVRVDEVGATLLRAASDVLATHGPAALTVRRIATEAGVSTMNVYSRFGGKDGVVEHLYLEGFARLRDAMAAVPFGDDAPADLVACCRSYRRFALANPTFYSVMFDRVVAEFEPSPTARLEAGATLQLLADRLARAMRRGSIAAADPTQTAAAVWATCHGLVSLELKQVAPPQVDWAAIYDTTTTALMAGLAGAPAAR